MESLVLALEVVFPLLLLMVVGYAMNFFKLCDESNFEVLNRLVFKIFLPVLLFYNVYKTNIQDAINPPLMLFCILAVVAVVAVMFVFIPLIEKDNRKRGVMIQGIFRSNFVLFGLPVTISLLGEANVGVTSVLIAVVVPLFNVLAVVCLEFFRGGKFDTKKLLHIFKGIVTNPLIIASTLGVLCLVFNIKFPEFAMKGVSDISKIATPLALIVLGGTFKFKKISANLGRIILVTVFKLVVVPAAVIAIAASIGYRGAPIVTMLSMFASPTAVSSFTMAQQMDGDGELAGQIVVCTTVFSIITIFAFVVCLKSLNLF